MHSLILGMTEMGKTTLARALSAAYRKQGFKNIVLDPLRDPRWSADFITSDGDEFLDIAKRSKRCMLFMDEGSESVGRYNFEMQWTATQSRHWGHSSHFIAQGAVQLAPIVRDQCSRVFLFCCGARNGKLLAEEFNAPELDLCVSLLPGEYFSAVRGGACSFHSTQRSLKDAHSSYHSRQRSLSDWRRPGQQKETGEDEQQRDSSSGSGDGDSEAASADR